MWRFKWKYDGDYSGFPDTLHVDFPAHRDFKTSRLRCALMESRKYEDFYVVAMFDTVTAGHRLLLERNKAKDKVTRYRLVDLRDGSFVTE